MTLRANSVSTVVTLFLLLATSSASGQSLVPVADKANDTWNGMEELPAPLALPQQSDGLESIAPLNDNGPEQILQRYPDGTVQIKRHVKQDEQGNYVHHGRWELFNRRGQILADGDFVDGRMEGLWKRWHPADSAGIFDESPFEAFEGPFLSQVTFAAGKMNGVWTIYDRHNRKIMEIPYRDGQRDGTASWYWPDGSRMREISFVNGTLDGEMKQWDRQQQVTRRISYDRGKELIDRTQYYTRDRKRSQENYLGAELQISGEDDWWNARLSDYQTIGQQLQHGISRSWYRNGQLKSESHYTNGLLDGEFVSWHENGQKQSQGHFRDGVKTGLWTWWHDNGMKAVQGVYDQDVPVEEWFWWDRDGQMTGQQGVLEDDSNDQGDPLEIID